MTLKSILLAATFSIIAAPALTEGLTDMTDAERASFREEVRAYLLDNAEVIFEAVEIARSQQRDAEEVADTELVARYSNDIFNDGFSVVGGNPDGDVTIVEFLDYRCGYCRKAHQNVAGLLESDGNVRWIIKEYPILGEDSLQSTRVALATLSAYGRDQYLKMHDVLMEFGGSVNDQTLNILAEQAGLDAGLLRTAMLAPRIEEQIGAVRSLGQNLQVTGTPTFLIGNQLIRGYVEQDVMAAMIAEIRETSN